MFHSRQQKSMQTTRVKKKLDEIGYWLETFPRKEMAQLAQQTGVSGSSARKAITELQRWHAIRQLRFNRQIWIHTNDFFFGGKLKDKVCSNNPRTDGLKKTIVMYTWFPQFHLRHFDVQRTICLLYVRCVCGPKENISSAFFKYCIMSKTIILTEIH
jgi:hypothetical protein